MHARTNITSIVARGVLLIGLSVSLSACGTYGGEKVFVVDAEDVQRGSAMGVSFTVKGNGGYDRIWNAAVAAMSNGMTVIESHKPSGVIKSRVGAAPSGKIVGFWITPTAPNAIEYRIETSSVKPIGLNSTNGRGWEPVVVDNFNAALESSETARGSQPSSETSAWILKQTHVNVPGLTYLIEGGNLIRRLELASPMSRGLIQQTIPIAQIARIGVLHTDKYLSYTLSCNVPCVEHLSKDIEGTSDLDKKKDTFLFEIYHKFDSSFPPRMNRALHALIEEHGGKAQLYELPKPKEAF